MKRKISCLLICFVALLVSCKKISDDPAAHTALIKVKEYKTNVPLAGVKISLYRCSNYDIEFGCQSTALFAAHVTDDKGEYTITQGELNQANEGIILSKLQYWDSDGGTGENLMEPEAWANIMLKASKIYPDTSIFELNVTGELGLGGYQSFKAPKDSIVHFRLIGNEMNEVKWVLYTKDLKCYQYCIRDTLAFGSLSLKPQKFETLASSIDY